MPPPGIASAPMRVAGFEGGPEAEEKGAEGKCEEDVILRGDTGGLVYAVPNCQKRIQFQLSVAYRARCSRWPRGSAGLAEPRVALQRKRQVGAEWRIGGLIVDQFLLGGEKVGAAGCLLWMHSRSDSPEESYRARLRIRSLIANL